MPIPKKPSELREMIMANISQAFLRRGDAFDDRAPVECLVHETTDFVMRALAGYDAPFAKAAEAGEPTFTLRAQDKSADRFVDEYLSTNMATLSALKINEGFRCADAMRAWPKRKLPD